MCIKFSLIDTVIDTCKLLARCLRDASDEVVAFANNNPMTSDARFPFTIGAAVGDAKHGGSLEEASASRVHHGAATPPSPSLSVADALGAMSSVATGAVLRAGRERPGVPARSSLPEISAAGLGGAGTSRRRGASFLHLHIPERGGWAAAFGAHHRHVLPPAITLTPAASGAATADAVAPRKFSFAMGLRRLSQTTLHRSESMTSLCFRALSAFVAEDNLPGMQAFMEARHPPVDDPDENGTTALMVAVAKNRLPFVRELITHGADVNAEDGDNWSSLLIAAKEGFLDICIELLDHGANIEHKDMGGWSALMWACYKGRGEVAAELLDRGADANSAGNFHVSSLLWSAGRGHIDIVRDLIRHGAKVNMGDKYGTSALVWASRKGHTEIVECLLNAGANVDTAGMYSWTALLVATTGNHVDVVSLLLAHKPNVNALDKDGCTALTVACKEGYHEVVVALLSAGAYINIQDRNGDTNLIHAVKGGHRSVVEQLLRKYADVDICGKDRKTAVYWAVEKGLHGIVKLLLTANPDLELPTKDGDTALLRAVRIRNADIVQLLLDKKAKVSAADKKGDTALHIAMRARSKGIVEVLLRNPKNSQLLYRPNRLGETPYNIDVGHQKTILGQIFGARRLNTNEDNENMLGYDLYSSALADILSEPSLSMPITVGLYAKWGSGKSFLLDKLREEMKNFARQWVDPVFQFTALMFLIVLHVSVVVGVTVGLATQSWIIGLACGGGSIVLAYTFLLFIWYASQKYDWYWPYNLTVALTKKLTAMKLVLQVAFCHPPGAQWNEGLGAQPIRFYFTEQTRVSSTAGGENSVVQMLGSLYDSIEADYGSISTRLYRAFRPKAAKSTSSWRWRRLCCVPYSIIFELGFVLLLVGLTLLTIYLLDLPLYETDSGRLDKLAGEFVLIAIALVLGVGLLSNLYTWGQMMQALFFSQRKHLQRTIARLDTLRSEGFLQALRTEVTLMTEMVKCLDSFTGQQTRLVVIVDGLDSCEQDKVLLVLDAVHMLFSDTTAPFIVILAIDPHIISKAVELNSRRLFSESNIGGQDYLRNMVHLPFYLQNSGLRNVKAAQAAAAHGARAKGPGWGEPDDAQHFTASTNVLSSVSSRRLSTESGLSSCEKLPKVGSGSVRKGSRKLKVSESIASSLGSNLNRVGGAQDLTKMLLTDDYFSDVNPRSMRRLMNVVYVTGRLLKAFQIDFNWYHLASWVNITEQWPFRTSWLILHHDNCVDTYEDSTSLKAIYDKVRPQIPSSKDAEPLLELDRDERKFDVFLTFHRSSLLVSDLKVFLPFTINLDPYLKKVIKEEQQNVDEGLTLGLYGGNQAGMVGPWGQQGASPGNAPWPSASKTSVLRRQRPMAGKPAETPAFYQPAQMMGWPQSWMGAPPEPAPRQASYPSVHLASTLPPEVLEVKLSTLTVEGVCNLFSKIDDLSQSLVDTYTSVITKNNINGRVLLHCDMNELKAVLQMSFGDWELFRMLLVSLREYELTSLSHLEENPKNVRFSVPTLNHPQQSSTERKDRNGKSSSREEKDKTRSERQTSKQSVMEKQVTLEEQMICGALQTLNEEACEDVLDEADEKAADKPELGRHRSASQSSHASVAAETEMIFLQASPLSHPFWQPVSSTGDSSGEGSPAVTPLSVRRSPRPDASPRGPPRRPRPSSLLADDLPAGLQHLTPPPSPKHRVAFRAAREEDAPRVARQPSAAPPNVASALKRSSGAEEAAGRARSRAAAAAHSDDETAPLIARLGGGGDGNVLVVAGRERSADSAGRVMWPMETDADVGEGGLSLSRLGSLEVLAAEEEVRLRKRSVCGSFSRQNALDPEDSLRESNGNISSNPETRV